ncbi:MAG: sensor domain-containing diguanylate cyclase [Actinomycetota bacterium]
MKLRKILRSRRKAPTARTRLPLHLRFARGYQAGLIVGILIGGGVWVTTQSTLDSVDGANADARRASSIVAETQSVAATLGAIEDDPTSLVLRSTLGREVAELDAMWVDLATGGDLPDDVALLLAGNGGLEAQMGFFIDDVRVIADDAAIGVTALDAGDGGDAGRLEGQAAEMVGRLETVVGSFEARGDDAIAGMRTTSHVMFGFSVFFLVLLVGLLLRPLKDQLRQESSALRDANRSHKAEARRQELATHLSDGLEAAETEDEAQQVVTRAFSRLLPDHPIEMLIASTDRGTLRQTVTHPEHGGPGCDVEDPWSCPAVRRGRTMHYDDSRAINACPHLANRDGGGCAATCVPVSFMGQSMGVLHTTREIGADLDRETSEVLNLVASQVSIRLGTLRSFAQVEMQASTDSLTGLPNRRATEDRLRRLLNDDEIGAVAMADLDRFKLLNDRYGHEAGDRALRMFADAVRESLRGDDWIGRWGGEEFLLVMPGLGVHEAKAALDRVREHLADACVRAEAPAVTVSMGVVDTTAAVAGDELVRLADDALLVAKAQGRDRVIPGPVMGPIPDDVGRDELDDADSTDMAAS